MVFTRDHWLKDAKPGQKVIVRDASGGRVARIEHVGLMHVSVSDRKFRRRTGEEAGEHTTRGWLEPFSEEAAERLGAFQAAHVKDSGQTADTYVAAPHLFRA